jgi:hypothetical protein
MSVRQGLIFTILFFGVICFCFAQQDRPSDKDVKQMIENVEKDGIVLKMRWMTN